MSMNRRLVLRSTLAALGGATAAGCSDQKQATTPPSAHAPVPSSTDQSSREPSVATPTTRRGATEVSHGPRSVRKVALTLILSFLLVDACGLCCTYGALVLA